MLINCLFFLMRFCGYRNEKIIYQEIVRDFNNYLYIYIYNTPIPTTFKKKSIK